MDQVVEQYLTPQQLIAELDRRQRRFRQETITLKNVDGWPRGRWYCRSRDDNLLYVVITNDPLLNYLDFSNYALFSDTLAHFSDKFILEERAERLPMTLDSTIPSERQNSQVPTSRYCEQASRYLEEEHRLQVLMNVLERWNPERFSRLINHRLDAFLGDFVHENGFNFYIGTLILCCEDSDFIVSVFRQICTRVQEDNNQFLIILPNELMHFFMRHLKRVDYSTEVQQAWLRNEDPLRKAFWMMNKQRVRDALEMGCSSIFLPSGIPSEFDAVDLERSWPREKDGIERRSFYSCEYYLALTDALVRDILAMESDNGVTELLKLFWRTVPTPYLPIDDMQTCMRRIHPRLAQGGTRRWQRAKDNMWALMRRIFEDDHSVYNPNVYGPRKLQHLCRVCIRQLCRSPEGIHRLPLPTLTMRYMNLDY